MNTMIFQLQAPLSSWGDVAVGEYRPSADHPTQSAILGLLGAALGVARSDDVGQLALRASVRIAVGVIEHGSLLRDYHTAQVPGRADLKKRPHATRRDELALPKSDLNTILSTRDYRQNAAALVAMQSLDGAVYGLEELAAALLRPRFVLYLGRKACPLGTPVHPRAVDAPSIRAGFDDYQEQLDVLYREHGLMGGHERLPKVKSIVWGEDFESDESVAIGAARDLSVNRRDQVISRAGWQFSERREHIAIIRRE